MAVPPEAQPVLAVPVAAALAGAGGSGGGNTAGAATGGAAGGGTGGAGGNISVNAGTFNMSNAMSNVGQSAAGMMVVAQNSGIASLVQQSVNVQANLAVGK
jgi:hypothetical protein